MGARTNEPKDFPQHLDLVVVKGVRAVDPSRELDAIVDVVVERGRITRIGADAAPEDYLKSEQACVIDGQGRWLLPAFVDLHAHFREPGQEYKEEISSGLRAAAAGGFGHVCCMANTKPINDTRAVTELMVARAREHGGTRLHPIAAITKGQRGEELGLTATQKCQADEYAAQRHHEPGRHRRRTDEEHHEERDFEPVAIDPVP